MAVKEAPFMGNFSGKGQPDDARPRTPNPIEQLHIDMMRNGPARYGVSHPREVPEGFDILMRFVDMRATYDALPAETKEKIDGKTVLHFPRATQDAPKPDGQPYPFAIRQPRTNRAALLLPMSRTARASDLPEDEGRALTSALWQIAENSPYRHDVILRSNQLILWDNLASAHDNPAYPRTHDRVTWFCNVVREGDVMTHRLERVSA
jgi:alpha-ketoglutarate-dependent taurine dioxygenase